MVENVVRFLSFLMECAKSFELLKADQHKCLDLIGNHFFFALLAQFPGAGQNKHKFNNFIDRFLCMNFMISFRNAIENLVCKDKRRDTLSIWVF